MRKQEDFQDVPVKKEIVDRPYQIEAVKRVLEVIDRGKRKFLLVQATGTGAPRCNFKKTLDLWNSIALEI